MISHQDYQARRRALSLQLPVGCVAIIPAACETIRNGDVHYKFRQDSDFYYLTGFNEPDAVLVITTGDNGASILFNRERNLVAEQWTGTRLGQDDAIHVLGIDYAYSHESIDIRLPELLVNMQAIYYSIGRFPAWETRILQAWQLVRNRSRQGVNAPAAFCDLAPILSELRLFKSPAEIALIKQACNISVMGHERAMRACKQADYEYQLEAELLYEFTKQGSLSVAYGSIVAGGKNACVLHYTENNQRLTSGDLVLIDAGAEIEGYAADITRTFPINGKFSVEQRAIYELVLKSQRAGIECVRPGCVWDEIQNTIVHILTDGLLQLGILHGSLNELIENNAYKPFYMHSSGHWLGLDVHDCGKYKIDGHWRALEAGMVLTVEPGLYIPETSVNVDARWWGIGVRIEDDILVTENGYENLTCALAVEIDDLEALIND